MNHSLYNNYKNQFISLANLSVGDIPDSLEFEGTKFIVKSEFHITLLAAQHIAEIIDKNNVEELQLKIIDEFYKFSKEFPLTEYELLDDMRLVTVGDSKTIVVTVNLKGIEEFFKRLEGRYRKALPVQPTHITLYTLPTDTFGIPIFSYEELQSISRPIKIPELLN